MNERIAIVEVTCSLRRGGDLASWAQALYTGTPVEVERAIPTGALRCRGWRDDVAVKEAAFQTLSEAIEAAQMWLTARDVDTVAVRADDALGAIGLSLARASEVAADRVYALLAGLEVGAAADGEAACRRGLVAAGVTPSEVGYLDLSGGVDLVDIAHAYRTGDAGLTCAVGGTAPLTTASPLWAVARAALMLRRRTLYRTLPAMAQEIEAAGSPLEGTPFYAAPDTRPWFTEGARHRRVATLVYADGERIENLVLVEPARMRAPRPTGAHAVIRPEATGELRYLIPLTGETPEEILDRLAALHRRVASGAAPAAVAEKACAAYASEADAPLALALVGSSTEGLLNEVAYAAEGVVRAAREATTGYLWQSPGGSCFTAAPLGSAGVAFVYPGAFNSYLGLGRDLFQHFPDLHDLLAPWVSDLERATAAQHLYPRSRSRLTEDERAARQAELWADPPSLIGSGTIFAIAHTLIVRGIFGVVPQAALGYSLGETSMLWAAGVWQEGDRGAAAMRASPLFRDRIVGPKAAVRAYWGLAPDEKVAWSTYLLKLRDGGAGGHEVLQRLLDREPRVDLTLINQPGEVVISGDEGACRRVIEALDCHALPVPYDVVIHSPAVASEVDAFAELYSHPVVQRPATRFYSAAAPKPLMLERAALADTMARMTCEPVDFPELVQRVYDDGARVFVELGPLGTCTRRIQRILRDQAHSAVAINPRPGGDYAGVISVLAHLVTQRVSVDLAALTGASGRRPTPERRLPEPRVMGFDAEGGIVRDLLAYRRDVAGAHAAFLDARHTAQVKARDVIALQVAAGQGMLGSPTRRPAEPSPAAVVTPQSRVSRKASHSLSRRVVYDEAALREFAEGDAERCFGPDFAVYRGRRLPRIPNGDLLLMSRVVEIAEDDHVLVSELDVADGAWFYDEGHYPDLPPYAVLMEMGLQPCGVLSAHRRTSLLQPEADLYFRNLDGVGELLAAPDLRGQSVQNTVRLLSSVQAQGAIVQRYTFALSCRGRRFYEGEATFGYFRREALGRQNGEAGDGLAERWPPGEIDAGRVTIPADTGVQGVWGGLERTGRLQLLDEIVALPRGGDHGQGHLRAQGRLSPSDWFFRAHFHQDPVMPGSLGVEAALQAMARYARWRYPHLALGATSYPTGSRATWRYRGQLTPADRDWAVEVHLAGVHETADRGVTLVGDAEIWKRNAAPAPDGGRRIYRMDGLAIRLIAPPASGLADDRRGA